MERNGFDIDIDMHGVTMRYGDKTALTDITVNLKAGRIVGLLGENGAGKSTFIHLVAGVLAPSQGDVSVSDARVGWCSQRLMIDWFVSGRANIWMGACMAGLKGRQAQERTDWAIDTVGLNDAPLDKTPELLSGGQQQRLMIARVLAMDASILLLDEPTVGLDVTSIDRLGRVLAAKRDEGKLIVISSHDFAAVEDIVDDVLLLDSGSIMFYGAKDEFIRHFAQEEQLDITIAPGSGHIDESMLPDRYRLTVDGTHLSVRQPTGSPLGPLFEILEREGMVIEDIARKGVTLRDAMRTFNAHKHEHDTPAESAASPAEKTA